MRTTSTIAICMALAAAVGCGGGEAQAPDSPAQLSRIAGWKGSAVNSPGAFRFVVMSDRTGGHEPGAWAQAVTEINRLKPDFVMCVGDLIEGYCREESKAVEMWEEFDALTRKLEAPFFYCPGNHDIEGPACRKVYTRRHGKDGKTYYSFDYRDCHFVVLDSSVHTERIRPLADAQWAWLEKDLAAARNARHVFIFEHHPSYPTLRWARMRKLLDARKTTIFAGHWHTLSYDQEDAIPYFVLAPTATRVPPAERSEGRFRMFAHVAVSEGTPSVSIIPLGQVLPRDFVSRAVPKRLAAIGRGIALGSTTPAGGPVGLELPNPTDVDAAYTLTWGGDGAWFAGGTPKVETLTVKAGKSAKRTYGIRTSPARAAPPTLEVAWEISYGGRPAGRKRRLPLLVLPALTAGRVRGITIDGKLDDWAGAAAHATSARWQVRDNPSAWSGPEDCSMTTRIGYDDDSLYLAIDVTDEALGTQAKHTWLRDGVEVFWDPRPAGGEDTAFGDPCRQVVIPLPGEGESLETKVNPEGAEPAPQVRAACRRREGGYTVELAIAASSIARGFRLAPGATLRMEVFVNDNDGDDGATGTTCMVLSGDSDASRNTAGYATVTFK